MRYTDLLRFTGLLLGVLLMVVLTPAYAENISTTSGWEITLDPTNTVNLKAQILIPAALKLATLTTDGTFVPDNSFTLEKTRWVNQTTLAGEDNRIRYQIELAGHTFEGEGVSFDGQNLYLKTIWLTTPELFWYNLLGEKFEANQRFTYYNVHITPGGKVTGVYLDQKPDCSLYSYWVVKIAEVALSEHGLSANGTVYLNCNFKTIPADVTVLLDRNLIPSTGELTDEVLYDIGKNGLLFIQEAELSFEWFHDLHGQPIPAKSLIFVRKARYELNQLEIASVQIEFGNFTLDDQLVIIAKAGGFYTRPVPFTIDGVPYEFENYTINTGSSGIWGWVQIDTPADYIQAIDI